MSVKEYLPKKYGKNQLQLIQGLVPKKIVEEVMRIKKDTGWTWDELLTAFCKSFIKEFGGEKNDEHY
jgi:hypothetical protein